MKLPSTEQQKRIEDLIVARFNSCISYGHVLRWLDNFEDEDQDRAIGILAQLRYYSYEDILARLFYGIEEIKNNSKCKCVCLSIGASGKSGDAVLYFVEQIRKRGEQYANTLPQALNLIQNSGRDTVLVFVDDIIGTGTTFCNWLYREIGKTNDANAKFLSSLIEAGCVKLLCIVASVKGRNNVKVQFPTISVHGDVMNKSFPRIGSAFGGSVSMLVYREMCHKYGRELEPNMPLGYKNNQLLVVFNHAAPNNTLPVIWSDHQYKGKPWFPLFPRAAAKRIERAEETKKDLRHQLVLLHDLFGYDEVTKELFKNTNLQLLTMVKMLTHNADELTIAQTLGISLPQAELLWKEGINRNLWNDEHKLTDNCIKAYEEKKKLITIRRSERREKEHYASALADGDVLYIPETFRGVK